jgi:hypothetical protein
MLDAVWKAGLVHAVLPALAMASRSPVDAIGPLLRQHVVVQSREPSHWDNTTAGLCLCTSKMSHSTRCPRIFSAVGGRLCRHRPEKLHWTFHPASLAETLSRLWPSGHQAILSSVLPNCKRPPGVDHVVSNFDVRTLLEHVSIRSSEIIIIDARVSTEARESKARDAVCSMRSHR